MFNVAVVAPENTPVLETADQAAVLGATAYHWYANAFPPTNPSVPATVNEVDKQVGVYVGCVVTVGGTEGVNEYTPMLE